MTGNKLMFKKLAAAAARLADSKQASDIIVYDVSDKSDAAYFAMVATVGSQPQMRAVEDEVAVGLKHAEGTYPLHRDGLMSRTWKVVDYGGLVVHIFESAARTFYALDRLYEGCETVAWMPKPAAVKPAAKKAPAKKSVAKKAAVKKAAPKKPALKKAAKPRKK